VIDVCKTSVGRTCAKAHSQIFYSDVWFQECAACAADEHCMLLSFATMGSRLPGRTLSRPRCYNGRTPPWWQGVAELPGRTLSETTLLLQERAVSATVVQRAESSRLPGRTLSRPRCYRAGGHNCHKPV
jgi:hypothetical protein